MRYPDGQEAKAGDLVQIDTLYRGMVIACMDTDDYLAGCEDWSYLRSGVMVDTDFAGLVHYDQESALAEDMVLVSRQPTR
ncbi:hypothetical protein [Xanthomonas pisi]|uniref:Uncharacterized protein n=1 Tax=Xanthomonas pisi TaxID=56457 RepID=A0A2S7D6E1_9XANT|nr:hypothetical protein [Xanthomonas pisi]KLD71455.1 hypothetical protein Y887_05905 [Xanthomonas pisi DSM 18956]PPU69377.1 hypothetical protein XpiCFBP4643_04335 [Xanthomonas pisi]